MSFAPASSRGAFLKARLAVNGIQCAARSFGTLTERAFGLLSSMGASSGVGGLGAVTTLSASARDTNVKNLRYFRLLQRTVALRSGQVRSSEPEHFGLRILGVEPKQRQMRIGRVDIVAAAADFAEKSALWRQMLTRLIDDAADDVEPIRSAVKGKLGLGPALLRQRAHALRIDIGRIGDNQVIALACKRGEEIAAMQCDAVFEPVIGHIARSDCECVLGDIDGINGGVGKMPRGQNSKAAGAGAEVEHAFDRERVHQ